MQDSPPNLEAQWPVLSEQLRQSLRGAGEGDLADGVAEMHVIARCDCGDGSCQSFYTEPPPEGAYPYPDRARNLCFEDPGWDGMLILDIVDERIHFVEVIDRPALD